MGMWMWGEVVGVVGSTHTLMSLSSSPSISMSCCVCGCVCAQVRRLLDEGVDVNLPDPIWVWIGFGEDGKLCWPQPQTHIHTSTHVIHPHAWLCIDAAWVSIACGCVWGLRCGETPTHAHTQLRWNVWFWGMGCTLPHTQAFGMWCVCLLTVCISPCCFRAMYV